MCFGMSYSVICMKDVLYIYIYEYVGLGFKRVRTAYTIRDLMFGARNKQSDAMSLNTIRICDPLLGIRQRRGGGGGHKGQATASYQWPHKSCTIAAEADLTRRPQLDI